MLTIIWGYTFLESGLVPAGALQVLHHWHQSQFAASWLVVQDLEGLNAACTLAWRLRKLEIPPAVNDERSNDMTGRLRVDFANDGTTS